MKTITIKITDEEYEMFKIITEQLNKNKPGWASMWPNIEGTIRYLANIQAFKESERLGITK